MLPIRATKRERGDGDLSDRSECEGVSEWNDVDPFWSESDVHQGSRGFFKFNLITSSDMLFCEGRPQTKGY